MLYDTGAMAEFMDIPGYLDFSSMPEARGPIAYHYTNAEGLLGILQWNRLWASSVTHLNDTTELEYGRRLFAEVAEGESENVRATVSDILEVAQKIALDNFTFAACLCQDADLLSQWRAYGKAGFALGFDLGWELSDIFFDSLVRTVSVIYEEEDQRSQIQELLDRAVKKAAGYIHPDFAILICQRKHPAFKEEREVRLITAKEVGNKASKWRVTKGLITPYIELDLPRSEGPESGLLPIVEIVIGPTRHPDTVERSVRALLRQAGHRFVRVRRSEAPLRS